MVTLLEDVGSNDYVKHGCALTDVLATRRFAVLVKSLQ